MTTYACLGHWYGQLLFGAPCVGALGMIVRDSWRKRKGPPRPPNAKPTRNRAPSA